MRSVRHSVARALIVAASLVAAGYGLAQSAVTAVSVVSDGLDRILTSEQQAILVAGTEELLASCNFSSASASGIAWPEDKESEWERWSNRDHALIRYAELRTFETLAGAIQVQELLLSFSPGDIPGMPLTKAHGEVTLYTKCSGAVIVELACAPAVEPAMPASYQAYCRDLRETGRPVFLRAEDR